MTGIDEAAFALLDTGTAQVHYADSISELVDQLIDGHGDLPDDDAGRAAQLELRVDALSNLAAQAQATVLASVGTGDLGEDALSILMHDRRLETPAFNAWDANIPLILLATSYAPHTDVVRPAGQQIIWLDPHTERTFVDALQSLGAVELFVRDPSAEI